MQSGVSRFSVSVDPGLLKEFDSALNDIGLNRSTAIQVAMRDFLTEHRWSTAQEGTVAGAVTMIYDHDTKGLVNELINIQHDHNDVVTSTTHIHIDHDNCLEILAVKGPIARIHELTRILRAVRGVKQIKLSMLNIE